MTVQRLFFRSSYQLDVPSWLLTRVTDRTAYHISSIGVVTQVVVVPNKQTVILKGKFDVFSLVMEKEGLGVSMEIVQLRWDGVEVSYHWIINFYFSYFQ